MENDEKEKSMKTSEKYKKIWDDFTERMEELRKEPKSQQRGFRMRVTILETFANIHALEEQFTEELLQIYDT